MNFINLALKYTSPPYILITAYVTTIVFWGIKELLDIVVYKISMHYTYTSDSINKCHKDIKKLRKKTMIRVENAQSEREEEAIYANAQAEYDEIIKCLQPLEQTR